MKQNYDLAMNITAERIYRRGKWKTILPFGLGCGVFMFIGMTAINYFDHSLFLAGVPHSLVLLVSFAFWSLWGLLVGWMQWQKVKRRALRAEKPL
jgi:uncharacterized membrane protein YfcA